MKPSEFIEEKRLSIHNEKKAYVTMQVSFELDSLFIDKKEVERLKIVLATACNRGANQHELWAIWCENTKYLDTNIASLEELKQKLKGKNE